MIHLSGEYLANKGEGENSPSLFFLNCLIIKIDITFIINEI